MCIYTYIATIHIYIYIYIHVCIHIRTYTCISVVLRSSALLLLERLPAQEQHAGVGLPGERREEEINIIIVIANNYCNSCNR